MRLKRIAAAALAALIAVTLASCSYAADGSGSAASDITEIETCADGILDTDSIFSTDDLIQSVDTSQARTYTLGSGSDISITRAGTYVLTGSAEDTQIAVQVGTGDTVRLVLDGVTIENEDRPCINIISGDKVIISTAEGSENSLSVTDTFAENTDTSYDAVIYSREDLTVNGHGTLTIESSENGIASKDDLKVTGGTLIVSSVADALEAKDSVAVAGGDIVITSDKDGIHSEDSDSDDKGYVYMCGGSLDIAASDDAVHAATVIQIDGGTVKAEASEGLEGTYVQINGGEITLDCADDGINAAQKSDSYTATAEINGGTLIISMAQGDTDAIDSNGNLYINGGTVDITGQNAFDYTAEGALNGGTVTVNGEEVTELTNQFADMGGMPGMAGAGEMPGSGATETDAEGDAADSEEAAADTAGEGSVSEDAEASSDGKKHGPPSDGEMPEPPSGGERPERPSDSDTAGMPGDGEMPGMPEDSEMPEGGPGGGMAEVPGMDETTADTGTDNSMIIICAVIAAAAAVAAGLIFRSRKGWIKGKKED